MTACTATRIIGPAHDRTEIGCDLRDGHAGDHIQRDAFGRGSNVTYAWTRTTLTTVEEHAGWFDTHCYSCGGELERPISSLTEDELNDIDGPNSEHQACFE